MFSFFRRIKITDQTGVNVGKTGVSVSKRGKRGSIGTSGFSIRLFKGASIRITWRQLFSFLGGKR